MERATFNDDDHTELMLDFGVVPNGTLSGYLAFLCEVDYLLFSYTPFVDTTFTSSSSPNSIEQSSVAYSRNLAIIKANGLSPIALFRQGERFAWLDKLLFDGEPYIGLLPMSGAPIDAQKAWLDMCFTVLTDVAGLPVVKVHGFGVNKFEFLQRYPWYSVDSNLWYSLPDFGMVFIPRTIDGFHPDYTKRPLAVHYTHEPTLHKAARARLNDYFVEVVGVPLTEALASPILRRRSMLHFLNNFSINNDLVFRHRPAGAGARPTSTKMPSFERLRIMHTTFLKPTLSKDLLSTGTRTRHLPRPVSSKCSHNDLVDYLQTYGVTPNG